MICQSSSVIIIREHFSANRVAICYGCHASNGSSQVHSTITIHLRLKCKSGCHAKRTRRKWKFTSRKVTLAAQSRRQPRILQILNRLYEGNKQSPRGELSLRWFSWGNSAICSPGLVAIFIYARSLQLLCKFYVCPRRPSLSTAAGLLRVREQPTSLQALKLADKDADEIWMRTAEQQRKTFFGAAAGKMKQKTFVRRLRSRR